MALNITINKVPVAASFAAGTKVADIAVLGGTSPYTYSLATGGDYFQINGTEVQVKADMNINNIQSFSVIVTDSTSETALTATSDVVYPNIQAAIQNRFNSANKIYKITKDIDLGNGVLTIPAGCTLDFQGGSFSNGIIAFNKTMIKGHSKINCRFKGTIGNTDIKLEWFEGDDYNIIQDAIYCINITKETSTLYGASFQKIIFKSNKTYSINNRINFNAFLNIDGNNAIIKQEIPGEHIFSSNYAFKVSISNLSLYGTNAKGIYIDAPNLDAAAFNFDNLQLFTDNHIKDDYNYAIYLNSRSCKVVMSNILCLNAPNFLKCNVDFIHISDSWINGYSSSTKYVKPQDTCSIDNNGTRFMTITNCIFIPEYDGYAGNKDTRWIDNYCSLSIQDSHFGGENAGFPIIWQYANSGKFLTQIDIQNTQCAAGGHYKYWGGVVVLMNNVLPANFTFKHLNLSIDTYLISLYGYVKDNSKTYNNVGEVLQDAAPLFVAKINSLTNDGSILFPSISAIDTPGLPSPLDIYNREIKTFTISNNNVTANNPIIFADITKYNAAGIPSRHFIEYKIRADIAGYYKGYLFSVAKTFIITALYETGLNPSIWIDIENAISKKQSDIIPISKIDINMSFNIISPTHQTLSILPIVNEEINSDVALLNIGYTLLSSIRNYSGVNTGSNLTFRPFYNK